MTSEPAASCRTARPAMTRWLDGPHRLARAAAGPAGVVAGWWARSPVLGDRMRTLSLWAALAAAALALPVSARAAAPMDRGAAAPRTGHVSPRSDRWEKRVVELTNARRR